MFGDWWLQQGLFGEELERWLILCYESHAEEIYLLKSKRKHNLKRKRDLFDFKSSIRGKIKSLFLDTQFRVFRSRLYLLFYLDCPGGELFYYLKTVKRMK